MARQVARGGLDQPPASLPFLGRIRHDRKQDPTWTEEQRLGAGKARNAEGLTACTAPSAQVATRSAGSTLLSRPLRSKQQACTVSCH